jgi:hypothetical protein
LRFLADIDLDEARHPVAGLVHRLPERGDEARAVERVDAIEQRHRVRRLVRLQAADEVQLGVRPALAQRGPLAGRFLHAVLAEYALTGLEQRRDRLARVRLADRDQRDLLHLAPRDLASAGDAFANGGEARGCAFHGARL